MSSEIPHYFSFSPQPSLRFVVGGGARQSSTAKRTYDIVFLWEGLSRVLFEIGTSSTPAPEHPPVLKCSVPSV